MGELDILPTREHLLHGLYEAAELEHNLMCTYLYAAFSLRDEGDGLSREEASTVARWRNTIMRVAVEEMGHLTAVWNITSALGGTPHFDRDNFPLSPGSLPAGVVVKLAPFDADVLQHFVHLERPAGSSEPDGAGFAPELSYLRGTAKPMLTPSALNYDTVGVFYATLAESLRCFVAKLGDRAAFAGDPALQLSPTEVQLAGAQPVLCMKTALNAFTAIVRQGEGASEDAADSHFQRFVGVRTELRALAAQRPDFRPALPAAVNPVLRRPFVPGRIWIEDEASAAVVDLANAGYALMLRLLAYTYSVPSPAPEKALAVDLSLALMRAVTLLGEQAARMPAGAAHPGCNAGMSFTALRDSAPFPHSKSAGCFFIERFGELAAAATRVVQTARTQSAARQLSALVARAERGFSAAGQSPRAQPAAPPPPPAPVGDEERTVENGMERVEGKKLTLLYEGKKCIHARFCVTGAPRVFLANVEGPWIHPDAMDVESLVGIAHACPSGAIRYRRKDGRPDEAPPPVNLVSVREAGPYAVRGDIRLDGAPAGYRLTLCRCGASKNKPYCDGSHHDVPFTATGEPPTGADTAMLPVRDGPLAIDPQPDGPLQVRGNLEIISGTGRMVSRLTQARLCRCGASASKPFCDGSHVRIGFKSL
jgi:CDGSH-type Zn-finger protein/uncharacterized Fe-S cluster protein YjdI